MTIHRTASEGFARVGADYERGRPTYPQAAIDHLVEVAALGPGTVVADVGEGTLAVLHNVSDTSEPWVAATEAIFQPLRGTAPSQRKGDWRQAFMATSLFSPLKSVSFSNPQMLTPDEMIARVRSISFIGALPEPRQSAVLAEVAGVVAHHPDTAGRQQFVLPHTTTLSWCQRR